jgi:hypothetical protein
MSFRIMTAQEYLATTRPWVTPAHHAHQALMGQPITAAIMPQVIAAHNGLEQALYPSSGPLAALIEQAGQTDQLHDNLMRCQDARLTAELLVTTDPAERDMLQSLRDLILPEGLAIVQKSYAHEVGHAQIVGAQLTGEQRSFLQSIPMRAGTLSDIFDAYQAAAETLGDLEHQRRTMGDSRPGRGALVRARNHWVQVVNLVLQATMVLDDPELQKLAAAVERAKQQAVERRRLRMETAEDSATPAPDIDPDIGPDGDDVEPGDLDQDQDQDLDNDAGDEPVLD